jgi:lipid-binding SYLF domain-containing protein
LTRRELTAALTLLTPTAAMAAPASDPQMDRAASAALRKLLSESSPARQLNQKAAAVLVFPKIVKAGFLLGGAYGEGALLQGGRTTGYYQSSAVSYGLQAGAQWFGYALFFMNNNALSYLNKSEGFELGTGPSLVVADSGFARRFSSSTITQDIYAFIFGQNGLMAGAGIEGSKITKVG